MASFEPWVAVNFLQRYKKKVPHFAPNPNRLYEVLIYAECKYFLIYVLGWFGVVSFLTSINIQNFLKVSTFNRKKQKKTLFKMTKEPRALNTQAKSWGYYTQLRHHPIYLSTSEASFLYTQQDLKKPANGFRYSGYLLLLTIPVQFEKKEKKKHNR